MIGRKLGRRLDHRESLLRNLASSVILYERVVTTTAKAKAVQPLVERLINIGKDGTLGSFRRLLSMVFDPKAARKIVEELVPRYKNVTGGYVILHKLMPRKGDGTPMSMIELRGVNKEEATTPTKMPGKNKEQPTRLAQAPQKGTRKVKVKRTKKR